jgi:hypothetical protein
VQVFDLPAILEHGAHPMNPALTLHPDAEARLRMLENAVAQQPSATGFGGGSADGRRANSSEDTDEQES